MDKETFKNIINTVSAISAFHDRLERLTDCLLEVRSEVSDIIGKDLYDNLQSVCELSLRTLEDNSIKFGEEAMSKL